MHDLFIVKRIIVSTYQSVSGAGKAPMDELLSQTQDYFNKKNLQSKYFTKQIAFNAIPHIDSFLKMVILKRNKKLLMKLKKFWIKKLKSHLHVLEYLFLCLIL